MGKRKMTGQTIIIGTQIRYNKRQDKDEAMRGEIRRVR